ncbi:hypothetical protein F9K50_09495 [bacterium]|nr:MAG: hypothetical protein F9K50_09495 [bacterium]
MKIGSIGDNKAQQNFSHSQRRPGRNSGFEALLRDKLQARQTATPAWVPAPGFQAAWRGEKREFALRI